MKVKLKLFTASNRFCRTERETERHRQTERESKCKNVREKKITVAVYF